MSNAQRISFGVFALALLIVGAYGAVTSVDPTWPGLLIRAGIVVAAIWFAAPSVSRVSRRTVIGISVVAAVLVIRPRLILLGLAAGVAAALLAGRSKRKSDAG